MNRYFENGVARQERAETKEEAKYFFECTCNGWYTHEGILKGGCNKQLVCDESKCPVARAYKARIEYLDSPISKMEIVRTFSSEKPKEKKKQILTPQYRAKVAIVHYLDSIVKKILTIDRELSIKLENVSVQIYVQKDIFLAMEPLREKYPDIYYKAAKLYWKYGL